MNAHLDPIVLDDEGIDRLWRVHRAARLLAALDQQVASYGVFSADGPAALAEYIAEDVLDLLTACPDTGELTGAEA